MRFHLIFLAVLAILNSGCPVSRIPTEPPLADSDPPIELESLLSQTLTRNRENRGLSTELHGAWQILHGVLAYGRRFEVDTSEGTRPAIDYLQSGGSIVGFDPTRGDLLGQPARHGLRLDIQPVTKIGQGHRDQWLAVLVQSGLDEDAQINLGGQTYTMRDWVNQAQYDVPLNLEREYSWTLIALTAYDDTDHSWTARDGERYNIESLLDSELRNDLQESVCGGTHRLIGIAMTLQKRKNEGAAISEVWQRAQQVVDDSIASAKQNQNPDGSYSVAYLHRPGWARDLGEALGTTGHVLEFLALAASDETLREPWVQRSARRICEILDQCEEVDLECGVLYHALHGLAVYRDRITT
jgi:hypothetical protein